MCKKAGRVSPDSWRQRFIEIEAKLKSVKSAESYKINVTNDTIEITSP